jgi:dCMP deaminase
MSVAHQIKERSYDPRRKVGAIIVPADNSMILSLGYNGNAKGLPNFHESSVPGESGFIHAEQNALYKLDYRTPGEKKIYVTTSPCLMCAKGILQCNISTVIYDEEYRDLSGVQTLLESGRVEVFRWNGEELVPVKTAVRP